MIVVVTGGAGFIGSNFILHMLQKHPDYRIICVDKLTYAGNLSNLSSVKNNENFRFVKADICDYESICELFIDEKPDAVVNFAAESHVDRSLNSADRFFQTNTIGTSVILEACIKCNVNRFHQVSTDEVYGDMDFCDNHSFTETSPLNPRNPYSSSKAAADLIALSYSASHDIFVTVSRCSNNYGPYHFPEKLIPLMIISAQNNQPLPIYGTGENIRDWIYVKEHCEAVDLILHGGANGEIYNISANSEIKNIDVVKMICRELGVSECNIKFIEDRKGHDKKYSINSNKIFNELGWRSSISFEDGIKETVKWYLDNRSWWMEIIGRDEFKNYYNNAYKSKL